ncbi:DUF4395 domain-containing protein [Actinacidiphila epipremni]|uniref:DUF4395 domain-containing protein n=1 Tax=Actinacidiphila epipremni TaxID=2053013 RepID=A0ABX0ZVC4_9ACTN|nr:DUF4395 domain-containing protein [Actinacidiphila epipremni]NJP46732.1 DUF4395 domain-containing protein [Actinacidiphila epipremni]
MPDPTPDPIPAPAPAAPTRIDPRGPRFGAAVTTVVLLAVLATGSGVLLAAQAAVFAAGAVGGLRFSPYGWVFRHLVRPRLGPPQELEDERPPRFAQAVGLGFAVIGAAGYLSGTGWLGIAASAAALVAAFLNAAFGYCLGCELYLFAVRTARPRAGRP